MHSYTINTIQQDTTGAADKLFFVVFEVFSKVTADQQLKGVISTSFEEETVDQWKLYM